MAISVLPSSTWQTCSVSLRHKKGKRPAVMFSIFSICGTFLVVLVICSLQLLWFWKDLVKEKSEDNLSKVAEIFVPWVGLAQSLLLWAFSQRNSLLCPRREYSWILPTVHMVSSMPSHFLDVNYPPLGLKQPNGEVCLFIEVSLLCHGRVPHTKWVN